MGHAVSPKRIMNSLIVTSYTLCLVGFNWPDSKKLIRLRIIGMSYSIVLLILSLLSFNEVIPFRDSWNIVLGGMCISFMLTALFQIYRVKTIDSKWKHWLKTSSMIMTVVAFSLLLYLFVSRSGSEVLFALTFWTITIYTILIISFYLIVVVRSQNIRSQVKAAQDGR